MKKQKNTAFWVRTGEPSLNLRALHIMTSSLFRVTRNRSLAFSLIAVAALAGCGGGSTPAPVTAPVVAPPAPAAPAPAPLEIPAASSDLAPSCSNCGATTSTSYSGSGVGIWSKKNTGTAPVGMQVDIVGMVAKDVTLVFTNETKADVSMTSVPLTSAIAAPLSSMAPPLLQSNPLKSVAAKMAPVHVGQDAIEEFNRIGFKAHLGAPRERVAAYTVSSSMAQVQTVVGDTRTFSYRGTSDRLATLKKQITLSDGVKLNVWVESTEVSELKVSDALIAQLSTTFGRSGGVYDMLKETGGPLWGPHNLAELLPSTQPLEIVILNFAADGQPFGELGYFHAINSFKKSAAPQSNEALSIYLDAETLYLGGPKGIQAIQGTLAHEGQHMSNFYRRGILMGSDHQYDTWLEEMTAMMMEDAAGNSIDANYNTIRDMRYPDYLSFASYNCPLLNFTGFDTCESYSVSGSFGGFLLRQMGIPFLKSLLTKAGTDSEIALQNAIQSVRPQSGVGEELRKFSAGAIAALPAASAPTGFGFPARKDGDITIPVIDAAVSKPRRFMPTSVPNILRAYASFPVVRKSVTGRFKETIQVPPGVTLSLIIN